MALTRAQLLSGNSSNGVVLPGQPQGVIAGAGITISTTGIISVNASTTTGLVKLNNPIAYNAYQWPNGDGLAGQFLQTSGTGILSWADTQGFAVVTVQPQPAPTPPNVGELWFDCTTGTLNVYQNCVGTPSPNWFNVAQPGLPVDPTKTSATPAFTGGSGTQASPYGCTVTTTGSGSTVQIIQTVTVTSLAPFQYVPIVDLNAVANGGRFSFTNNYADASGNLTFDIVFSDNPPSPSGTPYTAAIKVGYGSAYIQAVVNVVAALVVTGGSISGPLYVGQQLTYTPGVPSGGATPYGTPIYQWFADGLPIGSATGLTFTLTGAQLGKQITASTTYTDAASQTATGTSAAVGPVLANPGALTITSPGSITPATNVVVGATLNYTAGTFTGGIPTVTPSWKWQRNGTDIAGVAANATSYVTVSADAGQAITVRYQVQDSATPTPVTQFASTTAVTPTEPFPGPVWSPTPANAMNTSDPGVSSGVWNGPASSVITATGCAEVSLDGTNWSSSVTVSNPQTLYQRWKQTLLCGLNDTGQTITGTVTNGTYTNSYSLLINRVPSAAPSFTAATGAPGAVVDSNSQTISGMNATTYITYDASSTGDATTYFASVNGGAFVAIPAAPSTSLSIESGQTLILRQTASSTPATARNLVINIGDADGNPRQQATYTVTSVSTPFPSTTFTPTSPNAAPATIVPFTDPVLAVTLNGTASVSSSGNTWSAGGTTLTGSNIQVNIAGGGYTGSGAIANGQSLSVAWDTTYLSGLAHDATASGSISGTISGITYTTPFSFQVKKSPTFTIPTGTTGVVTGSTINTGTLTVDGYNCPVTVSISAPTTASTATMTAVTYTLSGVGPTSVSVPGSFTIYPSQTLLIGGTVDSTVGGYNGLTITIGSAPAQEWRVRNATVVPAIATPSITSPSGSPPTLLNPALNSPAGITLQGDTYTPSGGASTTQTSSSWEVYKWVGGGPASAPTTDPPGANYAAITGSPLAGTVQAGATNPSVLVPQSALTVSSTYYARVQYATTNASPATSSFSNWSSFATAAAFAPAPGTAMSGGFFAGQINDGGTIYNLIVAPAASGQIGTASKQYKTTSAADTPSATFQNEVYGKPANDAGNDAAHPAFQWARALTIGGFTDWYIPAKNELEVCYYFLKPTTTSNDTSSGSNPNAVSPEPISTNYTAGSPARTTAAAFQFGGAEAFGNNIFWSSTENSGNVIQAWYQGVNSDGSQAAQTKNNNACVRAIRRVAA